MSAVDLRARGAQLGLLVLLSALAGALVGMDRPLLGLLRALHIGQQVNTPALGFLAVLGLCKALSAYAAGRGADRWGPRAVLIAGWVMVAPLPFLLTGVSSWGWFHAANVMLGLSHGLIGSATLIWMIDLAGPARRGWAAGLHGAAGAGAMALSAHVIRGMLAGQCLRPITPLAVGVGYVLLGAVLVATLSRQPRPSSAAAPAPAAGALDRQGAGQRSADTSGHQPARAALDLAGFVHKAIDGVAWGLLSRAVLSDGLDRATVGALLVGYPIMSGLGQLLGGALSDRVGRRPLVLGGMVAQALAIVGVAAADAPWAQAAAAALLGLGAAALSPALIAAVSDLAPPARRASAIGAHRLWRELGFVAGAVLAVLGAEAVGLSATLVVGGVITLGAGLWVGVRVWGWGGGGADLG